MPEEVVVMAGMQSSFYPGLNQSPWFPSGRENMYMPHGFGFNPPSNMSSMAYSQPKVQHQPQPPSVNYYCHLLTNLCSAVTNTFSYFTDMVAPSNSSNHIPQAQFPFGNNGFDMNVINDILSCSKLNPEAAEFWPGIQDCRRKGPWADCQRSRMKDTLAKGFQTPTMKEGSQDWFIPASTCDTPYDLVSPQGVSVLEEGLQSVYYESIQEYNEQNKRAKSQASYQQQQKVVEDMIFAVSKNTESEVGTSDSLISDLSTYPHHPTKIGGRSVPEVPSDQIDGSVDNLLGKITLEKANASSDCKAHELEDSSLPCQAMKEDLTNSLMTQQLEESVVASEGLSLKHRDFRNEDVIALSHGENTSVLEPLPLSSSELESPKEDSSGDASKYLKTETIPSYVQNERISKTVRNTSTTCVMAKTTKDFKKETNSTPGPLEPEEEYSFRMLSYADIVKGRGTSCTQSKNLHLVPRPPSISTSASDDSVSELPHDSKPSVSSTTTFEVPMPVSSRLSEVPEPQSSYLPEVQVPHSSEVPAPQPSHVSEGQVPLSDSFEEVPVPQPSHVSEGQVPLSGSFEEAPLPSNLPNDPSTSPSHSSDSSKSKDSNLALDIVDDTPENPLQLLDCKEMLEKAEDCQGDRDEASDDFLEWSGYDLESNNSAKVKADESLDEAYSDDESDDEDADEEWTFSCISMDGGRRRNFSESSNTSSDSIVFSDSYPGLDLSADEIDGSLIAFLPEGDCDGESTSTGCSVKLLEFICSPDDSDDDDEEIVFSQNLPSEQRTCMWVQKSCELSIKSTNTLPEFNVHEPRSGYGVYVSFSTAADDDLEQTSVELEREACLREVNRKWNQLCCSQPDKVKSCTKVKFQEAVMIVDVPADEDRKGPWALYALDSERFRRRIEAFEKVVSPVLCPSHRDMVYNERF